MVSLKSFAPVLANNLGMTPAAIYERQRALIRANVLPAPTGRGRGNGLKATVETVALMVIALMATGHLSDTDKRVKKLAEAQFENNWRHKTGCALTGAQNFRSALVAVLESEKLASAVSSVSVLRNDLAAIIYFKRGRRRHVEISKFGVESEVIATGLIETTTAKVSGDVLKAIGAALRAS
jgi:hypothetical protein